MRILDDPVTVNRERTPKSAIGQHAVAGRCTGLRRRGSAEIYESGNLLRSVLELLPERACPMIQALFCTTFIVFGNLLSVPSESGFLLSKDRRVFRRGISIKV